MSYQNCEEEKTEMAGARVSNATRCTAQNSPTLDTGREAELMLSQGDLAKKHGERDEGMRTDLGNHHQSDSKSTAVALSCGSLMYHSRQEED